MPRINYVSTNGPGGPVQQGLTQWGAEASDYGYVEIGSDNLSQPGSFPFRVDQSGNISAGPGGQLARLPALQVATPLAGYALVNGTGTIVSWTTPNDGIMHRVLLYCTQHVTSIETGGAVGITVSAPDGGSHFYTLTGGGTGVGFLLGSSVTFLVAPNSPVTVAQSSALTAGAATFWAEIWGS